MGNGTGETGTGNGDSIEATQGRPEEHGHQDDGAGLPLGAAQAEGPETEVTHTGRNQAFNVNVARRYHAKLARHYERLSRASTSISLIGGTAVITQLLSRADVLQTGIAVAIVLASTLSLIFDWTGKAGRHRNLYARYGSLAVQLKRDGQSEETEIAEIEIEKEEEAILNVLFVIAWNEEANAQGVEPYRYKPYWHQRRLALWCDVGPASVWELARD